ncbi:hypothetical protein HZS_7453 [Henneguya salminicola]|nr:hypothetical protein HZS_7453 [Henneguya salminicola]
MQSGGSGIMVEIYESELGKNKNPPYHPNGSYFLSFIRNLIRPDSIIIADCFRSNSNIENYYTHKMVDPSITYRSNKSSIQCALECLKYQISSRNRTNSFDVQGDIIGNLFDERASKSEWPQKN